MPTYKQRGREAETSPNWINAIGGQVPLTFIISGVVGLAVWYGTTNAEKKSSQDDIATLKATLTNIAKDQDEKRAVMAREFLASNKEFLASNKEISTKVGELATAIAVQQANALATSTALGKITDQLQQLNAHGGTQRR